ncbi:MAG: hypothetical protein PF693_05465, partial [Spirochaetia bacterium]|nr:hypothetical protein [Spirochaetia bacterium]
NILYTYNSEIENFLESKIGEILSHKEQKTYSLVKKHFQIYEKLQNQVRISSNLCNRKALWYRIIDNESDKLDLSIYSGKV